MKSVIYLSLVVLMIGATTGLCNDDKVIGDWKGHIEFTSQRPTIQVQFTRSITGNLTGKANLPGQNSSELTLSDIVVDNHDVQFVLQGSRSSARFVGRLSPDRRSINGQFLQAGMSYPFVLNSQATQSAAEKSSTELVGE